MHHILAYSNRLWVLRLLREPYVRKCAFDVGDYGLGFCAVPLSLGCDCLGHIHYFDAVLNNSKGEPVELKHAVCMHEEDAGLLWKHVDYRTGHSESRRSRRLVISFIATVVGGCCCSVCLPACGCVCIIYRYACFFL
jgi:hypothetical protein